MLNPSSMPVYIFGASLAGRAALVDSRSRGIDVKGFLDNDPKKWGQQVEKLTVYSIFGFGGKLQCVVIIVASQFGNAIVRQLFSLGASFVYKYQPQSKSNPYLHIPCNLARGPRRKGLNSIALVASNRSGSNTFCLSKSKAFNDLGCRSSVVSDLELSDGSLQSLRESSLTLVSDHFAFFEELTTMQFWHGFPLKTLGFWNLAIDQSAKASLSQEWMAHQTVFSYSRLYSTLIDSCFRGNPSVYKITGMPRNDYLISADSHTKLKDILNVDCENKLIGFWLPTYRETAFGSKTGEVLKYADNNKQLDDIAELCEYLGIVLVVKSHPYECKPLELPNSSALIYLSDEDLNRHEYDLYELLGAADFLITDYSSVYFDFLLLDRPLIFFQNDRSDYRNSRGFLIDENVDFWCPGVIASTLIELKSALQSIAVGNDAHSRQRNLLCSAVHQFRDAESSERVSHLIKEFLETNE